MSSTILRSLIIKRLLAKASSCNDEQRVIIHQTVFSLSLSHGLTVDQLVDLTVDRMLDFGKVRRTGGLLPE